MRTIGSALVATTLLVTSAFAATDSVRAPSAPHAQGALAPGKPAGVEKAQGSNNTLWWLLGAGVVIGGAVIISSGSDNKNNSGSSTTLTQ